MRQGASIEDWAKLEAGVAATLAMLAPEQGLFIADRDNHYFTEIYRDSGESITARTVSNSYLPAWLELGDEECAAMRSLGWQDPDEDHQDKWWLENSAGDNTLVAKIIATTLHDIFSVANLRHLTYCAVDRSDDVMNIIFPSPMPIEHHAMLINLPARLAAYIKDIVRSEQLSLDDDGDWRIELPSSVVFVRALPNDAVVTIFGPIVGGVESGAEAASTINDLNLASRYTRVYLAPSGFLMVATDIADSPHLGPDLKVALDAVANLIEGTSPKLRQVLGAHDPRVPPTPPETATPDAEQTSTKPTNDVPGYL